MALGLFSRRMQQLEGKKEEEDLASKNPDPNCATEGRKGIALAVVNQKGGVGKSTTAINLSSYLADMGKLVLLIDFDPQGNTSSGLGVDKKSLEGCIYSVVINDKPTPEVISKTGIVNLSIIPASVQLAGAEIELVAEASREYRLKKAISTVKGKYDYIIIDCPPSLGLLTLNALTAADELIIPVQCEYYALEGLSKLLDSVRRVKTHLNPDLKIAGVLMTMHDARTKISQQVIDEVKKYFKELVYETIIPRAVRLSEAPSFGVPISRYDDESKGAQAYKQFAREVMERAEKRPR